MITSNNNTQIKNLIQLNKKRKVREEKGVFIIEGIKMFEEAKIFCKDKIVKTYVSEHFYKELCNKNSSSVDDYFFGISYEIVQDNVFKDATDTITPQGILAIIKQPFHSLDDMVEKEDVDLVILEDLRDPGNLGTILRTAEGAGVTGVILSKESVDIYNPKVIRSTMGSIFRMPFVYIDDFDFLYSYLKQNKIKLIATHLEGAIRYDKIEFGRKSAIIIGNEANGLSKKSIDASDIRVKIPMKGYVESLNASVAAALFMYERLKVTRTF